LEKEGEAIKAATPRFPRLTGMTSELPSFGRAETLAEKIVGMKRARSRRDHAQMQRIC